MELGGIQSTAEAVNFLVDKKGHPYITSYVNHVSSHPNAQAPHASVPDIHAFNFPTGGQQVNYSRATSAAEAVTLLACTQIHKYAKDSLYSVQRFFTFATNFCVFVLSKNWFCW
jgi:hypothetical protein